MARFVALALALIGVTCVSAQALLGVAPVGVVAGHGLGLGVIGHHGLHHGHHHHAHGHHHGVGLALGHHGVGLVGVAPLVGLGHGHHHIPHYSYHYGVLDKHTHDQKQVSEHRHGAITHNQYSSHLIHG